MINLGILSLEHPHSVGNHIPALKYMKDRIHVKAIFHKNVSEAKSVAEILGAEIYNKKEELLNDPDIDVVLVTSINDQHAKDCIEVAKRGKDILCDKPIAVTAKEAREIANAVEENGVKFFTTYPVRFNTSLLKVKKEIEKGEIGRLEAILATNHGSMYQPGVPSWVLDPKQNGGGCIIDHTVHVADVIRWISGAEFKSVYVEAAKSGMRDYLPSEDFAVLHGEMDDGLIYQIDASWSRKTEDPMWGDVTFHFVGSAGTAHVNIYNNQTLDVYVNGKKEEYFPNLIVYEHGCIFNDYLNYKNGRPYWGADHIDGLRTVELVEAAYKSLNNRVTVEL